MTLDRSSELCTNLYIIVTDHGPGQMESVQAIFVKRTFGI